MKYSNLFAKTNKSAPHDADSTNARLLVQAGFIDQLAAGIYSYLPLGLRVLNKIKQIVREEMQAIGGQEVLMPALIPKSEWERTGRWDSVDVNFKLEGHGGKEYALGSTHEEVITPLVAKFVKSYKDLPVAVYQIQDKFRNEARAKSGLLRGREFAMKDLYSFHTDEADFEAFYETSKQAYLNVFTRCGLDARIVEASGGVFTQKHSHEFQVATPNGEDLIFLCGSCSFAQNKEIVEVKEGDVCPSCGNGTIEVVKSIEVGNIFPLETRFSHAIDWQVAGPDGKPIDVIMGCYGIGPSRVMGSIIEVHNDDAGMMWPKSVAPFTVHLVSLSAKDPSENEKIQNQADDLYHEWTDAGIEVLWDDREGVSAGEKFADADLIGVPLRLVVSAKSLAEQSVEWKERSSKDARLVSLTDILEELTTYQTN